VCFGFRGGDGLKFSDVILAVASIFVIWILLGSLLNLALIPANTSIGGEVSVMVSVLISALIVGYVFAGKIWEESRMKSIGKIIVLTAVLMVISVMLVYAVLPDFRTVLIDALNSMYGVSTTASWTHTDWFAHELMLLALEDALFAVYGLVFGFIGLYLGSMRKPSAKTKE
jgi:ABC-type transport system involved in multi-copper enzyme maturation permease subunit